MRADRSIARARKVSITMKTTPDQLSLPLFDTTALTSSMGLYSGLSFGERVDDSIAETEDDAPAPVVVPARNFRLTTTRRLAPDWKTRGADNVAAIRLMHQIQDEARNATAEEQDRLALFTSFGASELANTLFRRSAEEAFPKGWEALGQDLEQLVSPGELASLARVTQYAHFTPEFIGSAIWRALRRMGFSGGRVLEPGCGTGLFFALMPEALADKTTLTGVEMDPITARIAKLLYPDAQIRAEDFTKARIADAYDLAVGNPPFSSRTVRASDPAGALNLSLHDYFIARSIERLRPVGLAAFVTSRWTMDKADPTGPGPSSPPWPTFSARCACPKARCAPPPEQTSSPTSCSSRSAARMRRQSPPTGSTLPKSWPRKAAKRRSRSIATSRRPAGYGPGNARSDLERLRPDLHLRTASRRRGRPVSEAARRAPDAPGRRLQVSG